MTNEEQQIDRPEEVSQPDNHQPETTTATDEVASTPVSETDEATVPPTAEAPIAEQPTHAVADEAVAEPAAEQPTADVTDTVLTTATSEAAESDSPELAVADAPAASDEPATEALPVDDPAQAGLPETTSGEEEPTVAAEVTEANYGEVETGEAEEAPAQPAVDYSNYSKQELVDVLDQTLNGLKAETVAPGLFRQADDVLKQTKPVMDQLKRTERQAALAKYVEDTGAEEGFQFRTDDLAIRYEDLYKQIKSQKNTYFQTLDKAKDSNFNAKTDLLRRLRELVESDESNAGDAKTSWNGFKAIQDEWKAAGNINSPHNATLWATYHALVDRYYSNRNIYFELKELDRKKNATQKAEVIDKVEAMVKAYAEKDVTRQTIDDANALFEEYKHIGPAPKAEQEVLWQRMKVALDALYEKRRGQNEENRKESSQLYEEKSKIYEELVPLTSFTSSGINDWNDKTKEVMAIQDRWNAIKGPMPREEGKELSKKFWAALKTFFANKGEFFRQLESKREENLKAKTDLCEQVEAILAAGDESADATQRVIEFQRQWKNIGQVPEKQKNSIFERFKAACDAFFDKKRNRNQDTDREFEANLSKKEDLIARIEASATQSADLSQLNAFKEEWNSIGFVPKKDKERIQKGYIAAINALVRANGALSTTEKERAIQDNEAEVSRFGGPRGDRGARSDAPRGDRGSRDGGNRGPRQGGGEGAAPRRDRGPREGGGFHGGRDGGRDSGGYRDSGDYAAYRRSSEGSGSETRRRISSLENDIATYQNNIEFFARSKNADQLRADIEKKIADAQRQIEQLRNQE
ncbi:DUF349 domain-containing protein [Fibrivirga algicola]|uniref:DUF349 domain-containing protein n=1 Tax=Fibrivirga algicola TaxID=2950420 RepID=A0ABX0QPC6_9BACT|nr:DUF349 domain-containing protein [Fibrivirga algicola]NID12453.1 DUF349 domain-containing protein [Fibrivirga algicola]